MYQRNPSVNLKGFVFYLVGILLVIAGFILDVYLKEEFSGIISSLPYPYSEPTFVFSIGLLLIPIGFLVIIWGTVILSRRN
ncbi:MAG: hypothetical protein ACFE7R_10470 [Candidatus Hodarchaeota archaeon]